jgi:P pilus assembly chaperone PapD
VVQATCDFLTLLVLAVLMLCVLLPAAAAAGVLVLSWRVVMAAGGSVMRTACA